jgi:hypothetical protein
MSIYTLKNVKIIEELSEETICFTASLYRDGKRLGTVSNRGHGGMHDFDHTIDLRALAADAREWCEADHARWCTERGYENTALGESEWSVTEHLITELLVRYDPVEQAKRWRSRTAKKYRVEPSSLRVYYAPEDHDVMRLTSVTSPKFAELEAQGVEWVPEHAQIDTAQIPSAA